MLYERDDELATLQGLLDRLPEAGGQVALVRGRTGLGKTTLIAEFLDRVEDRAHVLSGACDDLLTPEPFGPIWDIGRDEPAVAEAVATGERRPVVESLFDLLSRGLRPTVLVVEDTQWADEATLDLLTLLLKRISTINGVVVVSYRDDEVARDHPIRQVIASAPVESLTRIRLGPLSQESISEIVDGTGLNPGEVEQLTGGNPLFLSAVVRHGTDGTPASIQDAVLARTAGLSNDARELLDLVSVAPGGLEIPVVEKLVGVADSALAECEETGLVEVVDGQIRFTHELQRRAVEEALTGSNRRRFNQHIVFEVGDSADPARVAHHARESGDGEAIVRFAGAAATAAVSMGSHRDAAFHFRSMEPHLDLVPEADRPGLLQAWARSEFLSDNPESLDVLDRAVDLWRDTRDTAGLARALTLSVRLNEVNGRPDIALRNANEAIELLRDGGPSTDFAFALAQRAWVDLMRHRNEEALVLADKALAVAAEVDDAQTRAHALNTKGFVMVTGGDETGWGLLEQSREVAAAAGLHFDEVRALINLGGAAHELRDIDRVLRYMTEAKDLADKHEVGPFQAYAEAIHAEALQWKGHWSEAEDQISSLVFGHSHVEVATSWQLGMMLARKGGEGARTHAEHAWLLAERSAEPQNLLPSATAIAELTWLTGDGPVDIDTLLATLDLGLRAGMEWGSGDLATWLWRLGHIDELPDGVAEPHRLLGAGDVAGAAAIWRAKGIPYDEALALMHGDVDQRIEALRLVEGLGASVVAARIRDDLRRDGVQVGRGKAKATRDHVAGLTARQAEVLALLAEDLSNPDIADRLFLSPRTVENHVAAVLLKLGAANRSEAVSLAREQGLLSG